MEFVWVFIALIILSYLFIHLLKTIKIPEVVALLLLGIFFGFPQIQSIVIGESTPEVELLGMIGLFALLFLAGLESSWETLKREELDALYIALFCLFIPLILGFVTLYFLLGFSFIESFIVALCISITAESAKARVLFDLGVLKSRVASALLGAGIIDDILAIIFFSVALFFLGIFEIKEYLILLGIVLSFLSGLVVQRFAREHHLTKKVEIFSSVVLIPFFFISMGMNFSINEFSSLTLLLVILLLGIGGKLLGAQCTKSYVNFTPHQLHLMGWAMNSRGALDIALAVLAFSLGVISQDMFSSLIILALVSTLSFPIIIGMYLKNDPEIMN